jgi:Cd2+/Zn2+-exporting ATPase
MNDGKTLVFLADETSYLGMVSIRDNLRVSAPFLIEGLNHRNIRSMILSGDNLVTVDSIAQFLSIDERQGELLPSGKLDTIEKLQQQGKHVAMVGDGINDAPALSQANVGIAMGLSGTDIALESADIAIMNDDLTKILVLLDIGSISNRIIRQNIWFSIIVKVTFAILTVVGLMSLALAVGVADMLVSLLVILNGFRVLRYKSKFQNISEDDLYIHFTRITCNACIETESIPQHHGREMIQRGDKLVCWQSLIPNTSQEPCTVSVDLRCTNCQEMKEIQ